MSSTGTGLVYAHTHCACHAVCPVARHCADVGTCRHTERGPRLRSGRRSVMPPLRPISSPMPSWHPLLCTRIRSCAQTLWLLRRILSRSFNCNNG